MAPKFLNDFKNYGVLLRNKQYRKQWFAGAISRAGSRVHWIALLVLVFEMTGRALDLGVLMICMAVPGFLLAPVAGIIIDRIDRKLVLVTADFASAVLVFIIPFTTELWQIYVIAGALGACGTFFGPAMFASLPKLVSEKELVTANFAASNHDERRRYYRTGGGRAACSPLRHYLRFLFRLRNLHRQRDIHTDNLHLAQTGARNRNED